MTGETAARCGNGKSLSWRSRDSNWWTSAVELSNSLATKIDQVGFFLIPFVLSFFLLRVVDLERKDCEEDVGWKVRNPWGRIVLCILSSRCDLYLIYICRFGQRWN